MYLTEHEVRGIATYTRIGLADDEISALTTELNAIIERLKPITEYDLTGIDPTYHPVANLVNVMREDVILPGLSRNEAFATAHITQDGQYRVPPILGEGGDR